MASQAYKERIRRAVDDLPDRKAARVAKFAESLRTRKTSRPKKPYRPLGLYRGKIRIDPTFFDPLPDDILAAFEGRGK